ncbi:MAG TPA: thioesterase family protein [Tessaracoccus flavescens]|uniref:Thioesterase family protein n=1 Tax=Tessaracoccus flavescens TaxID=399497 RepID=A0A921EN94_9ACTN|nr:thioesterase family protein [Tessaracoccus flavescens]
MNLYLRLLLLRVYVLFRPKMSPWETARTPFRVMPTDLDVLRHMNNGRYLTLMDLGRLDLMLRSGMWGKFTKAGWFPVVAGQTISYRRSLNPWQKFDLYTRFVGIDGSWIYMEQAFVVGDTVHAEAVIRARFLKRSGGSVSHDELIALIGEHPADRVVPEWMSEWNTATKPRSHYSPAP